MSNERDGEIGCHFGPGRAFGCWSLPVYLSSDRKHAGLRIEIVLREAVRAGAPALRNNWPDSETAVGESYEHLGEPCRSKSLAAIEGLNESLGDDNQVVCGRECNELCGAKAGMKKAVNERLGHERRAEHSDTDWGSGVGRRRTSGGWYVRIRRWGTDERGAELIDDAGPVHLVRSEAPKSLSDLSGRHSVTQRRNDALCGRSRMREAGFSAIKADAKGVSVLPDDREGRVDAGDWGVGRVWNGGCHELSLYPPRRVGQVMHSPSSK